MDGTCFQTIFPFLMTMPSEITNFPLFMLCFSLLYFALKVQNVFSKKTFDFRNWCKSLKYLFLIYVVVNIRTI